MKRCNKCGRELDESAFYKRTRGGLRSWCKSCDGKSSALYQRVSGWKQKHKKDNRDLYNHYETRRKYLLRSPNPMGIHTYSEWQQLKAGYGFRCLACGLSEPQIKLSPDHIVPVALGGTDDISNIQPLCFSCNRKKNKKEIRYDSIVKTSLD